MIPPWPLRCLLNPLVTEMKPCVICGVPVEVEPGAVRVLCEPHEQLMDDDRYADL